MVGGGATTDDYNIKGVTLRSMWTKFTYMLRQNELKQTL